MTTESTPEERAKQHRNGLEKVDAIFGGMTNPQRRIYADQYERSSLEGHRSFAEVDLRKYLEMASEVKFDGNRLDFIHTIDEILEKAKGGI